MTSVCKIRSSHVWANPIPAVTPIDSRTNRAEWVALLRCKDGLATEPAIPLEAMRRENLYEDRH